VKQFETVTNSAIYRDYINDPSFIRAMIVAGIITEPEKVHHFFIGVDVDALDPSDTQALQAAACIAPSSTAHTLPHSAQRCSPPSLGDGM
jgi:hypothetical protein